VLGDVEAGLLEQPGQVERALPLAAGRIDRVEAQQVAGQAQRVQRGTVLTA
jgi:hypothetical protein